jgi:predicted alpha-1,6-mannanase (GH76 family)
LKRKGGFAPGGQSSNSVRSRSEDLRNAAVNSRGRSRILLPGLLWIFGAFGAARPLPRHPPPRSGVASAARDRAVAAANDLLHRFWVGDAKTGHLLDTWNGYPCKDDSRGVLWERAMLQAVLDDLYQATRSEDLRRRIAADWTHIKRTLTVEERTSCGAGSQNRAQDDAGWSTLMYLRIYRTLRDPEALRDAKTLFTRACDRWTDDRLGGGAWYSDDRRFKSSYQASLVLAGIQLYDRTRDRGDLNRALALYRWCEKRLLRPDGLYWCEYGMDGPRSAGGIREAGSVTFLGGNMAMGAAHAMLYRRTGKEIYRKRAIRTADALSKFETDGEGRLLDDRDAWTNGYFMGDWVREVLTLKGLRPERKEIIRRTAESIERRDRTAAGYYGGCWGGPAEGEGCAWEKSRSMPEQAMTSASAIHVIVAAALMERKRDRKPPPIVDDGATDDR